MKTILVPVDLEYSDVCSSTLLYALSLARAANAQVVAFHAFTMAVASPGYFKDPAVIQDIERQKAKELEAYVGKAMHHCSSDIVLEYSSTLGAAEDELMQLPVTNTGFHTYIEYKGGKPRKPVTITCVSKIGAIYEQIMTVSIAYDADLIVMGIPGLGSKNQAYLGNTTLSVMRHSLIPVLAIPKATRFTGLRSAVFAANLLTQPEPLLLHKLRDFIFSFRLRLQVLHLHHNQNSEAEYRNAQAALEALDRQLYDINFKVAFLQRENIDDGIQEYILEHKSDLLILSPHLHNFAEKLLNKSLTQRMITKAFVPILALPTSKKEKFEERDIPLPEKNSGSVYS